MFILIDTYMVLSGKHLMTLGITTSKFAHHTIQYCISKMAEQSLIREVAQPFCQI